MSLGSRVSNRGRNAVFARLPSTPREPLLFLFPSWTRSSSTASQLPQNVPHSQFVTQQKPISNPKHAATLSESQAVLNRPFNGAEAVSSNDQQTPTIKIEPRKSHPPNIKTEDGIAALQEEQSITKDSATTRTQKTVRKVLSLKAINDDVKLSASSSRKAYQTFKQKQLQTWIPDWRAVLLTLVKHTPEHGKWLSNALKFSISPEDTHKLLLGIDDNFLEIGFKYGCQTRLGSRKNHAEVSNSFIVSGPATAISKLVAEILSIAPNTTITPSKEYFPVTDDSGASKVDNRLEIHDIGGRVRNVMSNTERAKYRTPIQVRPEDIRRPATWTQQTLLDYVRSLTLSHLRNHIKRYGFGLPRHDDKTTAQILRDLFKDPNIRLTFTREACHEMMKFWIRTNFIEDARRLFVHMEIMRLRMVPETFNILLAGAAKAEDIHNFHFLLHLMLQRGLIPNGRTWTHFMNAFSDVRIKLHILTAMQKKGLLNHPQTMIEATAQLTYPEIESSLDQNQTQENFIAHMDSRYGSAWVSNSSGSRIMNCLAAHGLISRCLEFLHFMDSRHVIPDSYAVHTILHHCKQAANLVGAVEILRSLPRSMNFQPCEETFRIMFELAWRMRSYNVAKVVWRYACLYGATTFRMREHVYQSMENSNSVEEPKTSRQRWRKFAGPVIIGLNHIQEHPSRLLEQDFPELEMERKRLNAQRGHSDTRDISTTNTGEHQAAGPASSQSDESAEPSTQSQVQPPQKSGFTPAQLEAHRSSPSYQNHLQQRALPQIIFPWGPSKVGLRLPHYKVAILKEILEADLCMFKHWEPVKAFDEMLTEALRADGVWKAEEGYRTKGLEWFLDGRAVEVGIRTKTEFKKELLWK